MSVTTNKHSPPVSRETQEKLLVLEKLVQKWSVAVNLVAQSTLPDLWQRHILDSLFLAHVCDGRSSWLDMGSGAGFPGLVVALVYQGQREVILVESDQRKVEFLRAARRELAIDVEIVNARIESMEQRCFGVISARALAPLSKLLSLAIPFSDQTTSFVFPKGKAWQTEVLAIRKSWTYDLEVIDSPTADLAVVLKLRNVNRALS